MPSTNRRAVLAAVGAASLGSIAGCSFRQSDEPPTGSLRFVNNDETVPHSITMRVTNVGTAPGEEPYSVTGQTTVPPTQRNLTASTTLESIHAAQSRLHRPGGSETYDSVFTEPVWYAIEFTVDDQPRPTKPATSSTRLSRTMNLFHLQDQPLSYFRFED